MSLSTRPAILVFLALAVLMGLTRINHFGIVPDASWAIFFAGGFYLARQWRWAFPALMAMAVAIDYLVITQAGLNFWQHYCVSPGYWFLLPAHLSLWFGGVLLARQQGAAPWRLALTALIATVAVALCHLFAQGGFYWFSDSVASPSLAGWAKNYADWFLPYLRTTLIYVGVGVVVHAVAMQVLGLRQAAVVQPR